MLYLGTIPLAGMLKTKLFTSSGTFVVPSDVYTVWIDGCGGGGGGGGGDPTPGGGGGGGSPAYALRKLLFPVTPAETLVVTVGAGGSGGVAGASGTAGGVTSVTGAVYAMTCFYGAPGSAGGNPNGGSSGGFGVTGGATGGAGTGGVGVELGFGVTVQGGMAAHHVMLRYVTGGAGGALTYNGGYARFANGYHTSYTVSSGTGGALGGGGGAGGSGEFGDGGAGGSNGGAGVSASTFMRGTTTPGYGAGGGGGSGNAAGGNGSPGFVRIYYISKYTVA